MRTTRRSPARAVVAVLARSLRVVAVPALLAAVLGMGAAVVVPPVAAVESIAAEASAVAKRAEPAERVERAAARADAGAGVTPVPVALEIGAEPATRRSDRDGAGSRPLDNTQLHPERLRRRQTAAAGTGTYAQPAERFSWPLAPVPTVSRAFQPPSKPYGPGHRGVDLVGVPGQPVLAAGGGTVVYAGPLADRGVVSVDHADGLRTSYEPVAAAVHAGQLVRRGEPVGALEAGHLGCPASACLHWGLRRDGQYLDPLMLVRPARVRLLPWPADPESAAPGLTQPASTQPASTQPASTAPESTQPASVG